MKTIIEVKDLSKHYSSLVAVDGVNFEISRGCCFGLLGPNGAGKTTTIEIIEGITNASSGTVLFNGRKREKDYKQKIGIQFQHTALQDFLTVFETLRYFKNLYKHSLELDDVIDMCSLSSFLHQESNRLSGGQKQRLTLALALINDPELIFLDEPTTGLDPQSRRHFWDLINKIKKNNKTIILTTHYMEEANILCDKIAIMDKGKIIAIGKPKDLLSLHFDDMVVILPKNEMMNIEHFNAIEQDQSFLIYTKDIPQTLQELSEHNININKLEIRTRNLEDLFLVLTGEGLRH